MKHSLLISMEQYSYELPRERIAEYPVDKRDQSRLLLMKDSSPGEDRFYNLPEHLPEGGMMVFNNTRVIRARLLFQKDTGARIEVFCLEPVLPSSEIAKAFEATSPVVWKCMIGNARKWRNGKLGMILDSGEGIIELEAERIADADGSSYLVRFTWGPAATSFAEVLQAAGKVPLPPYIERESEDKDIERYQTIYAHHDGSVAAPTAGLHFTDKVLKAIREKDIITDNVILHVSAGTFKPVSHDDIRKHEMHTEQVVVSRQLIENLLANNGKLTAVGTTSMRTLESLYWFGNELESDPGADFMVRQWQAYGASVQVTAKKALENILSLMESRGVTDLRGATSLIIVPTYEFKLVDILITNFHMPRSTLLLLVAAFAGDNWQKAYQYALDQGFRFLSYGDSCLFYRQD